MEKNTTLNKWLSTMERNLNDSSLFNMDFSSKENIMRAYEEAVKEKYRFFSFGDAMFIV